LVKHRDNLSLEKLTGQEHYNRVLVNKTCLFPVIEVTDGEERNIGVLSKAICNGKVSWTHTHIIPLTTQEYEKKNCKTTENTGRQSLHFNTADAAAITGSSHVIVAYFLQFSFQYSV
jgi:hypothetical protein